MSDLNLEAILPVDYELQRLHPPSLLLGQSLYLIVCSYYMCGIMYIHNCFRVIFYTHLHALRENTVIFLAT